MQATERYLCEASDQERYEHSVLEIGIERRRRHRHNCVTLVMRTNGGSRHSYDLNNFGGAAVK